MKFFKIILASLIMSVAGHASAQSFLSADTPDRLFNFGVRLGINSSNRTFSKDYFQQWNVNSWGTGIDAGVVFDINMRDFFSLQPGIFFESRSGDYSYAQNYYDSGKEQKFTQMGHYRTYNLVVPVMASFRFNVTDRLRWILEAGPYMQFKLHSTDGDKITVINPQSSPTELISTSPAKSRFADLGLKIGTGFTLFRHYSFFIHYMAGANKVWKAPHEGGHNKAWNFTLGYDF